MMVFGIIMGLSIIAFGIGCIVGLILLALDCDSTLGKIMYWIMVVLIVSTIAFGITGGFSKLNKVDSVKIEEVRGEE